MGPGGYTFLEMVCYEGSTFLEMVGINKVKLRIIYKSEIRSTIIDTILHNQWFCWRIKDFNCIYYKTIYQYQYFPHCGWKKCQTVNVSFALRFSVIVTMFEFLFMCSFAEFVSMMTSQWCIFCSTTHTLGSGPSLRIKRKSPYCLVRLSITQLITIQTEAWQSYVICQSTGRAPVFGTFEQCNQQLSKLICQNCDGSIKILLDVGNQQHAGHFIQDNKLPWAFLKYSGAEKLVPAGYWCPYGNTFT